MAATDVDFMPNGTKTDSFNKRLWKLGPWLNLLTSPEGKVFGNHPSDSQGESGVKPTPSSTSRIPLWLVLLVGALVGIVLMSIVFVPLYMLKDASGTSGSDAASLSESVRTQTVLMIPGTASSRGLVYTNPLADPTSPEFQKAAQEFCSSIDDKLVKSDVGDFYRGCTVTHISQDSVIEFKLEVVKVDGTTVDGLHSNVSGILERTPRSSLTKSGGSTYTVKVGTTSEVSAKVTKATACTTPSTCMHGKCVVELATTCSCEKGWHGANCAQRCEGDWTKPTGFTGPDPVLYDNYNNNTCFSLMSPGLVQFTSVTGWEHNPVVQIDGTAMGLVIGDTKEENRPCFQRGTAECSSGLSFSSFFRNGGPAGSDSSLSIQTFWHTSRGFSLILQNTAQNKLVVEVKYRTGSGGLTKVQAAPSTPSGWFHLAVAIIPNPTTKGDIKIYVDTLDIGGDTIEVTTPTPQTTNGQILLSTTGSASYQMDNFAIFEYAMTQADAKAIRDVISSPCASLPCKNGGICMSGGDSYMCMCTPGFTGASDCSAKVTCAEPTLVNAEIITTIRRDKYYIDEKIEIKCIPPYTQTSGSNSLTCLASGQWNGSPPVCTACPVLDPVSHTTLTRDNTTIKIYKCNAGYEHDPSSGPLVRFCYSSNGVLKWSNSAPVCKQSNTCTPPAAVTNAASYSPINTVYAENDVITYTCDAGSRTSGTITRTCQAGSWTAAPVCSSITCAYPGDVAGGVIVGTQKQSYSFNENIEFKCSTGYSPSGDATRQCKENGWTGVPLVCTDINECATNPCDVNANCTDKVNAFECTCKPGFTGDGKTCTSLVECTSASECGPRTACVNEKCACLNTSREEVPGDAKDKARGCVDIDECQTNDGGCEPISSFCQDADPGFSCQCRENHKIIPTDNTKCEKIQCNTPDISTFNSTVVDSPAQSKYDIGRTIVYKCKPGYENDPEFVTIECTRQGDNGVWNKEPLKCQLIEPCKPNPCGNHTTCVPVGETFRCDCDTGYISSSTGPNTVQGYTCNQCDIGYGMYGGVCVKCPIGTYQDSRTSGQCTTCPNSRTTTLTGSKAQTDCVCPAGAFAPTGALAGSACTLCPLGTYADAPGAVGSCAPCQGINVTTANTGSNNKTDCICLEGLGTLKETPNQQCGVCNNGYYAESGECKFCGPNYVSDTPRNNVSSCYCDAGYQKNATTKDCEACSEAWYSGHQAERCMICAFEADGVTTQTKPATSFNDCECKPGYSYAEDQILEAHGNTYRTMKCTKCGTGTYSPGGKLGSACQSCGLGTYTDGDGAGAFSECKCEAGYYGQPGTTGTCAQCPKGTYSLRDAAHRRDQCTECPTNAVTADPATTSIAGCYCPAGFAGTPATGGACTICPDGEWAAANSSSCNKCGDNAETGKEGAMVETDCRCKVGYQIVSGSCAPCPDGTYSTSPGGTCVSCGANTTTNGTGATSKSKCVCLEGFAGTPSNNDNCVACADGQWSTGLTGTCNQCGAETTTGGAGQGKSAADCKCKGGYATTQASGECIMCAANQYSPPGAQDCTACPDNTQAPAGSVQESDCKCPAGYLYNTSASNTCTKCPVDTYSAAENSNTCTNCPSDTGTGGETGRVDCGCKPGYEKIGTACTVCAVGSYKDKYGDLACTNCTGETTTAAAASTQLNDCQCKPGFGGTTCGACATGEYKPTIGNEACTKAPNNSVPNANSTGFDCDAGYMKNTAEDACDKCPAGEYSAQGATACEKCNKAGDSSITTNADPATSSADCVCAKGYGGTAANYSCSQCNVGFYKPAKGDGQCTANPTGSRSNSDFTYFVCQSGYYENTNQACEPCGIQKYKSEEGNDANKCLDCVPGGSTTTTGNDAYGDCIP